MSIEKLRRRQPGSPLWRIAFWHVMHFLCFVWFLPAYRYRAWGVQNIPETGPVLLVSNHQSFFDPILVGLGGHRRQFAAMARSTLFDHPVFAWLIRMLNAIPVEQGAGDMAAMRKCIEVLKQDHALLIFPEGARTLTGRTEAFETGTMLLIKRAKPMVLPVAVEGAFEAWPRNRKAPRLCGKMGTMYGKPIPAETLLAMKPADALKLLEDRVESMRLELAQHLANG